MTCSSCSAALSPRATFCAGCGARVGDPFLGTVVNDRYRVEEKIAVGGFGAIYRATQLTNNRSVAIKVMHKDLGGDENLVARFRREGVVLCNLRDAHTVTTYELDETADGRLYIVMELLTGRNLLEVFRERRRLSWSRVFAIARSICSALAEAHALGIVHRDLKPANIYLEARHDGADFVKVLDFGIAKVMQESGINDGSELTAMGQAVGTVEYMAPEQLMGGKCDGRTDIYTVGVVAFEMITGNRPYSAVGLDLLTAQLSQPLPVPSTAVNVPAAVDRVILRCLAPDASDRFADVAELARAIDEVLASEAAIQPVWHEPTPSPVMSGIRGRSRPSDDPAPRADTFREIERPSAPDMDAATVLEPAPLSSPPLATFVLSHAGGADGPTLMQAPLPPTPVPVPVPVPVQVQAQVQVQVRPMSGPFPQLHDPPQPRVPDVPFVLTVVPRQKPPRLFPPLRVLVLMLLAAAGVGAAIAWLF